MLPAARTASAQVQPATLVSNLGQADGQTGSFDNDQAQAFTTGSHTLGYLLQEVDVEWAFHAVPTGATVTVNRADGSAPGASLGTLTTTQLGTSFSTDRTIVYTAPGDGIHLEPDTTYFVVFDSHSSSTFVNLRWLRNTASDSEDTGGADGFAIADTSLYRAWDSTGAWTTWAESKKIAVKGAAKTAPITPDAPSAVIHEPFPLPRYIAVQRGDVCDAAAGRTWQDFSDLVDPWRDTMHGWRCVTWQRDHHRNTH